MATKKAAKKRSSKVKKTPNVNFTGTLIPDNDQTSTIQFSAQLTLTAGTPKRIKILVTGQPTIKKMALTD